MPRITADDGEFSKIGTKLRAARLRSKKSQAELGAVVGVTFQQIQKYEKGLNRIDMTRLMKFAEALEVSLDYFIEPPKRKRITSAAHNDQFDAVLATREGTQVIEAMIEMTQPQRALIADIAKRLPAVQAA